MARPRIEIDLQAVEHVASRGLTETQICAALNISTDTLRRRKSESDDVERAIERGRARGIFDVSSALFDRAVGGHVRAQMFYLRSRGGWQEKANEVEEEEEVDIEVLRERLAKKIDRIVRELDEEETDADYEAPGYVDSDYEAPDYKELSPADSNTADSNTADSNAADSNAADWDSADSSHASEGSVEVTYL